MFKTVDHGDSGIGQTGGWTQSTTWGYGGDFRGVEADPGQGNKLRRPDVH